jgi:CRP-like cAMP-binding protein
MESLVSALQKLIKLGRTAHYEKKQILLNEGDICHKIFIIEEGCIRSWFNDNGNDVTFQFFFEGDIVCSFESLKNNLPSLYNIETITSVRLRVITKSELSKSLIQNNELKEIINDYLIQRLYHYQQLFISRIKNKPQKCFEELLTLHPDIFEKIPHHYIATFLGITPVSLSRIRSKNKSAVINNC